jgi:hypothetical protein
MISALTRPPFGYGTTVGAPPRFVLDRANSTGNGVSTPRLRSAAASSAAIFTGVADQRPEGQDSNPSHFPFLSKFLFGSKAGPHHRQSS